jgi:hypothetical protein
MNKMPLVLVLRLKVWRRRVLHIAFTLIWVTLSRA